MWNKYWFKEKINYFTIILNILCWLVIIYLIFDLSNKRVKSWDFETLLNDLYTNNKSYSEDYWICWNILDKEEFDDEESYNLSIQQNWYFYETLEQIYLEKNTQDKLWMWIISLDVWNTKDFIDILKDNTKNKIIWKEEVEKIVNLSTLYYDHLFWSIINTNETLKYVIEKHNYWTLYLIPKFDNFQLTSYKKISDNEKEYHFRVINTIEKNSEKYKSFLNNINWYLKWYITIEEWDEWKLNIKKVDEWYKVNLNPTDLTNKKLLNKRINIGNTNKNYNLYNWIYNFSNEIEFEISSFDKWSNQTKIYYEITKWINIWKTYILTIEKKWDDFEINNIVSDLKEVHELDKNWKLIISKDDKNYNYINKLYNYIWDKYCFTLTWVKTWKDETDSNDL